jgi:hypothetical protein
MVKIQSNNFFVMMKSPSSLPDNFQRYFIHSYICSCLTTSLQDETTAKKLANRPFENVAKLKYSGMTLKNKNCIHSGMAL